MIIVIIVIILLYCYDCAYCCQCAYCCYHAYLKYCYNFAYCILFAGLRPLHADLGLSDHVWPEKRAAIAKRVDDLGDQFRPAMIKPEGWLAYIKQTYSADADQHETVMGQGGLVVPDDE